MIYCFSDNYGNIWLHSSIEHSYLECTDMVDGYRKVTSITEPICTVDYYSSDLIVTKTKLGKMMILCKCEITGKIIDVFPEPINQIILVDFNNSIYLLSVLGRLCVIDYEYENNFTIKFINYPLENIMMLNICPECVDSEEDLMMVDFDGKLKLTNKMLDYHEDAEIFNKKDKICFINNSILISDSNLYKMSHDNLIDVETSIQLGDVSVIDAVEVHSNNDQGLFYYYEALILDSNGDLWISDFSNSRQLIQVNTGISFTRFLFKSYYQNFNKELQEFYPYEVYIEDIDDKVYQVIPNVTDNKIVVTLSGSILNTIKVSSNVVPTGSIKRAV